MNKVAQVTLAFWVMKICATTLGETAGDLLSMTLGLGYGASTALLLGLFLAALLAQLRSKRFHPALYWTVILATSTAGTTMSDFMDRSLELGYLLGSTLLASALVAMLLLWKASEKSLSVDHIQGLRSESFYWATILVSNTLGTALGDYLADDSGLGFLGGASVIGGAILAIALAYKWTSLNRVALFWLAFVLTRPFGATFGDLLTKPLDDGGLALGTQGASLVLASILTVLVARSWRQHRVLARQ
ncbi:hypothetical protein PVT67_14195 [Gallaecimonas kandeliae]|uniref:COG4705 family protein n=1 Tax=Gallaecimonas kandeliae TaxID=3029055 RepID=UPI0026484F5D|nr:hypothetical protein [Gallaecimonas kandeliae]WKE64805.1 hypothetical protein PVT67_14195 [Gallaecimonas kandeliae]